MVSSMICFEVQAVADKEDYFWALSEVIDQAEEVSFPFSRLGEES